MSRRHAGRAAHAAGLLAVALVAVAGGCAREPEPVMPATPVRTPRPRAAAAGGTTGTTAVAAATPASTPVTKPTSPAGASGPASALALATPAVASPAASRGAVTAPATPAHAAVDEAAVRAFVERWRAAWERKDLDVYLGHYDTSFRGDGLDLVGWKERKQRVFAATGPIKVELGGVRVRRDGEAWTATFEQRYTSGARTDGGHKTLRLVLSPGGPGGLRIVSERFQR